MYVISQLVDGGDLRRGAARPGPRRRRPPAGAGGGLRRAGPCSRPRRGAPRRQAGQRPAGTRRQVKLADFGIAALADPDATVDDRLLGTLSYMAPEACRGERPAAPADVWAAGVLVYEALAVRTRSGPARPTSSSSATPRGPARSARCARTCRRAWSTPACGRSRRTPGGARRRWPCATRCRPAGPAAARTRRGRPSEAPTRPRAAAARPPSPSCPPSNVISLRELPRPPRRSARRRRRQRRRRPARRRRRARGCARPGRPVALRPRAGPRRQGGRRPRCGATPASRPVSRSVAHRAS